MHWRLWRLWRVPVEVLLVVVLLLLAVKAGRQVPHSEPAKDAADPWQEHIDRQTMG